MSQDKSTGSWIYSDYSKIKKIDEDDKKLRLNIHQKVNIEPFHYLSAIKMNSTYLEIANRNYNFYGLYSFLLSIMAFICCIVIPLVMIYLIFNNTENFSFIVLTYIFIFTGISYFVNYKVGYKNFKKFEYKSFYYLPIRFNRKNKKVYDWDELFSILPL